MAVFLQVAAYLAAAVIFLLLGLEQEAGEAWSVPAPVWGFFCLAVGFLAGAWPGAQEQAVARRARRASS